MGPKRVSFSSMAAFLLGIPVGVGVLILLIDGPWQDPVVQRYLSHPVEKAAVVAFCCAMAALLGKLLAAPRERSALAAELLPPWNGRPVPVAQAGALLAGVEHQQSGLWHTILGRRILAILDFVRSRGSANELDDQLRTLADNDALAQEGSFSLVRFICWATPILGFLGTVLGITEAIAGVTPEVLEKSLNKVTDGLALAFDTTALALFLTMILMFCSFAVERVEQGLLARVDLYVEAELAHRFERTGPEGGQFVEALSRNTEALVLATEQLVEKQATLWSRSLERVDKQWSEAAQRQQERLATAMTQALESTLTRHNRLLADTEAKLAGRSQSLTDGLARIADSLKQHTETLAKLQAGEAQLLRLQETLQQNLNALASTGTFEEAVQSLTAAIHLLTSRVGPGVPARAAGKAA
jgi:hypothetical protein